MSLKERCYSVLIVSHSENLNNSLSSLLPENTFSPVFFADNIAAAKRAVLEREFDLVIISAPLPDDFGMKFAIDLCNEKASIPLLLVKKELYSQTYSKVVDFGVFTLSKPTSPQTLLQALDWMCATRERLRKYQHTVKTVEQKMQEIRTVNRAKWLLIDVLKMSEDDAHKYIEKQAMDRCKSKLEIAMNIINTYS